MSLAQRPTTRAVPIDRTGSPMCRTNAHQHCAQCGVADGTVASTVTREGVRWPATCSHCSAKVARLMSAPWMLGDCE